VLPTFVIGLREALEASLIIGIIAAYLIQRGQRNALKPMWLGVAAGIGISAAAALILDAIGRNLPSRRGELLAGILGTVAVTGVTYMIVWMRRHSRNLKRMLEDHADLALAKGTAGALAGMAFFAVLREGLETAVFLLAAFQASANPAATGTGAVLGIMTASGLGYAIYRGGLRINLARFFRITGFVLVLFAGGILVNSVGSFQEAGVVTFLQRPVADLSWLVSPGTAQGSLLTGMFGLQPVPTTVQVAVWLLYVVPMAVYVLWPARPRRPEPAVAPETAPA
jgi:high-affinity iron transporter